MYNARPERPREQQTLPTVRPALPSQYILIDRRIHDSVHSKPAFHPRGLLIQGPKDPHRRFQPPTPKANAYRASTGVEAFRTCRLPRSISKEIDLHQMPTERRSVPPSSTKASSINLKRNRPPPNAHRTPKRSTFLTNFVSTRANLLGFGWNMTF